MNIRTATLLLLFPAVFGCAVQPTSPTGQGNSAHTAKETPRAPKAAGASEKGVRKKRLDEAADLLNSARNHIGKGNFEKAQKEYAKASEMGIRYADVELAAYSLLGEMTYYDKDAAAAKLKQLAREGSPRAVFLDATFHLMQPSPHGYTRSKTKAYLGFRRAKELGYKGRFPEQISDGSWLYPGLSKMGHSAKSWPFKFRRRTDPMTDKVACTAEARMDHGIQLGIDMAGAYLKVTGKILDARAHSFMGIRVDKGRFYKARIPKSYRKLQSVVHRMAHSVAMNYISKNEADEIIREYTKSYWAHPPRKIYVAYVGSKRFDGLLSELATGKEVLARVKYTDGSQALGKAELVYNLGKKIGRANVFDLYTYAQAYCLYGSLNETE